MSAADSLYLAARGRGARRLDAAPRRARRIPRGSSLKIRAVAEGAADLYPRLGLRRSPLFRLVEGHLDELLRVWPERFARQHGPVRAVVERVLTEFLRCGLLEGGFARLCCGECRRSVLVAFSCRGRSFCP